MSETYGLWRLETAQAITAIKFSSSNHHQPTTESRIGRRLPRSLSCSAAAGEVFLGYLIIATPTSLATPRFFSQLHVEKEATDRQTEWKVKTSRNCRKSVFHSPSASAT